MPITTPADQEEEALLAPVLIRLTPTMREQIRRAARTEERSQAQVIRRALRLYLEQAQGDS